MEMKLFDNWKDIPTIHLDLMDRKIFTGANCQAKCNFLE